MSTKTAALTGELCLKCSDCTGLQLHFWRKYCVVCWCRGEDHKAGVKEETEIQGILTALKAEELVQKGIRMFESLSGKYSFTPGETAKVAESYIQALPEERRPTRGTKGEEYREQQYAKQLPDHDLYMGKSKSGESGPAIERERQKYLKMRERDFGQGVIKDIASIEAEWRERGLPLPLRCRKCRGPFKPGSVGILAEKVDKIGVWHPNCFSCKTCDELLVDLYYFALNGKLACGRHHADALYPRCTSCDELIFSKEYTHAQNADWHPKHFCCFGCDRELMGVEYLSVNDNGGDDRIYCDSCYASKFALSCDTCKKKISAGASHYKHNGKVYHAEDRCFFCDRCRSSLCRKQFLAKLGKKFCGRVCYRAEKEDLAEQLEATSIST